MKRGILLLCLTGVALLFAACGGDNPVDSSNATTEVPVVNSLGSPVSVSYGETIIFGSENLAVTFDTVLHESRCPSDVMCIWEGMVVIQLQLELPPSQSEIIALTTHPSAPGGYAQSVDVLGYRFELLTVAPFPVSTEQIPLSDYVATLSIDQLVKTGPVDPIGSPRWPRWVPPREN